jgi:hypothetical protein
VIIYIAQDLIYDSGERLGLPPLPSSSQSESSEDNSIQENTHTVEESSDDQSVGPIPGSRKMGSEDPIQIDSSSEDNDFIVEDDDEGQNIALPMEYSINRAQPVEMSFKVVVQLFVHVACQSHHLRETYMEARLKGYFIHSSLQSLLILIALTR